MAASAPIRLGPYEMVSRLGKGGMGEVWRARDPRLNREVAIKVSAQQFTDRFEREAHAIAVLNHPNICTLFDVGPNYLVMELIEGPTLAERIAQGRVPLEEALGIARQIADALEAAHEKGIVHRDLKPANIKIRPDGSVKVLDFGLAKAGGEEAPVTADSPTIMSIPGMILGTAGYMAPEQARGQTVDKRADIWAFGVVLYEMVSGERLFDGKTVSDTIAAVLTKEPDANAPEKVRRLLRRCLEKDPRNRLRDIGDWAELLDPEVSAAAPSRSRFGTAGWVAAGLFALSMAAVSFLYLREKPAQVPVVRAAILAPENAAFSPFLDVAALPAVSPDGQRIAFSARSSDGKDRLWVRALDSVTAQPLAGTENGSVPFWSPDGLPRLLRWRQAEPDRCGGRTSARLRRRRRFSRSKLERAGRGRIRAEHCRAAAQSSRFGRSGQRSHETGCG